MMERLPPLIGGYVLAGGRSSRMGRDKALLELGGRPLIGHAVTKLLRVCADVRVLGQKSELAEYAPLVPDLHAGCGPLGGIEAALRHSPYAWNLFVPVDMPFLPTAFLDAWVGEVVKEDRKDLRVAIFTVDGVPQPVPCLLHREIARYIARAVEEGRFKLFPVLEEAGFDLAKRAGLKMEDVFQNTEWHVAGGESPGPELRTSEAQMAAMHLWFSNLNTPEEFAEAEQYLDTLDT
jgi:molybdenum cofactor guanylyltransferase